MSGERDEDSRLHHPLRGRQAQAQDGLRCPQCGWQAVRVEPWAIACAETEWQFVVALVAVEEGLGHG